LANNQPSSSSGSVIFDGRDDYHEALRIGIYIIFLVAINEGSGVVENMKTVVVVAKEVIKNRGLLMKQIPSRYSA